MRPYLRALACYQYALLLLTNAGSPCNQRLYALHSNGQEGFTFRRIAVRRSMLGLGNRVVSTLCRLLPVLPEQRTRRCTAPSGAMCQTWRQRHHLVHSSGARRAPYNRLDLGRESRQVLFDQNCNFIRNQQRIKRIVTAVSQHELERVFTGWKFDTRFRLPRSKMKM
jgi:hypothetical protein